MVLSIPKVTKFRNRIWVGEQLYETSNKEDCIREDLDIIKKGKPYKRNHIYFGLVCFYSISNIVGYLMTNPVYTYILSI